jgi:(2Fe-2S) ferredoxin
MSSYQHRISEFNLVGQLLGFVIKDGYKIKYLRVAISEREYWIKPDKEIRQQLSQTITPGCWVEIQGFSEQSFKTGKVKLRANTVKLANSEPTQTLAPPVPSPSSKEKASKSSILVCQKSNCWKRGGKEVCQFLEESLRDRGLDDTVQVKLTGCLKQCKAGPNVVMMPDKARYSKVRPHHVTELLDKHFVQDNTSDRSQSMVSCSLK